MSPPTWMPRFTSVDLSQGLVMLLIAGGLLVLVAVVLAARRLRRTGLASVVTAVTVVVILGTTVEGAIVFARTVLHAQGIGVLLPAIVFESIAVKVGYKAMAYAKLHGHPGRYGTWLIYVGLVAGAIVCMGGHSIGECAFRFALPLLGVWLVWLDLTPDTGSNPAGRRSSWRWTPRRIAIRLGLVEPGDTDLETVHHEHRIRALTQTAHRVHHGGWLPTRIYEARLRRLALVCDDAMVAEARRRVLRVHQIKALTNPNPAEDAGHHTGIPAGTATGTMPPIVDTTDGHPMSAAMDTRPDTRPVMMPAQCPAPAGQVMSAATGTDAGSSVDTSTGNVPDSDHDAGLGKPRVRRTTSTAEQVARLRRRHPTLSVATMAQRLRVSERTVRRYLPADEPDGAAPVNGAPIPDLIDAH